MHACLQLLLRFFVFKYYANQFRIKHIECIVYMSVQYNLDCMDFSKLFGAYIYFSFYYKDLQFTAGKKANVYEKNS